MRRAPIHTVYGNLVIGGDGGDGWAVFRMRCRSYRSEPRRKQRALVDGLEGLCQTIRADFQILRVCQAWDTDAYIRDLEARTPRRAHVELWREYLAYQRRSLEQLECWTPAVFVCVRLADPEVDLHGRAARLMERSPSELRGALQSRLRRPGAGALDRRRLAELEERAVVAQERVLSCVEAQPARADEVQWLIRRAFCRSLGEPQIAGLDAPQALSYPTEDRPTVIAELGNVLRWLVGRIEINKWRAREWAPALKAAGVDHRRIYDMRHTFATWSLAAGVSIFTLARRMGTSVKMIDDTYGHLAHDADSHDREALEAFDAGGEPANGHVVGTESSVREEA